MSATYRIWRNIIRTLLGADAYNYDRFDEYVSSGQDEKEFSTFFDRLHAGDPAPDASLTSLDDGSTLRLSDFWADRNLVIEFGSFT